MKTAFLVILLLAALVVVGRWIVRTVANELGGLWDKDGEEGRMEDAEVLGEIEKWREGK